MVSTLGTETAMTPQGVLCANKPALKELQRQLNGTWKYSIRQHLIVAKNWHKKCVDKFWVENHILCVLPHLIYGSDVDLSGNDLILEVNLVISVLSYQQAEYKRLQEKILWNCLIMNDLE